MKTENISACIDSEKGRAIDESAPQWTCALSAEAELVAIEEESRADKARIAELEAALLIHKHTDECLHYAALTGRPFCIASCADSRRAVLANESSGKKGS